MQAEGTATGFPIFLAALPLYWAGHWQVGMPGLGTPWPLLHWGGEGLALLPDHEDHDFHRRRGATVLRVVDLLGRDMHTLPRLEGHGRLPIDLEDQRAFQDICQLRPRVRVSPCHAPRD